VLSGAEGVEECARCGADTVLNSIVGIAGLAPTLAAIEKGSKIALANKETLVAGGKIVMDTAAEKGVDILPVDSEHSAIFQSLQGCQGKNQIKRLILTASGGPFFGKTREELSKVTLEQALKHPNWSMGAKITIDSATMMNKGLELIEARWLFDIPMEQIDVLVHPESIVHSLVEFKDGAQLAQLGVPDMRVPIQYAMTWPFRVDNQTLPRLKLEQQETLHFYPPNYERFPCLRLAREACSMGGLTPCVMNAANEVAVAEFLKGRIAMPRIWELISKAMAAAPVVAPSDITLDAIFDADKEARSFTAGLI
jgi:1-deoxy-D-xylulose-5-phosphate reductoisomerase